MTLPSRTRSRRSISPWNAVLVLFLLATCLKVWASDASVIGQAARGVPFNPGQQRQELLVEARRTNELLTDIIALLKSGDLHVRVQGADNQGD